MIHATCVNIVLGKIYFKNSDYIPGHAINKMTKIINFKYLQSIVFHSFHKRKNTDVYKCTERRITYFLTNYCFIINKHTKTIAMETTSNNATVKKSNNNFCNALTP